MKRDGWALWDLFPVWLSYDDVLISYTASTKAYVARINLPEAVADIQYNMYVTHGPRVSVNYKRQIAGFLIMTWLPSLINLRQCIVGRERMPNHALSALRSETSCITSQSSSAKTGQKRQSFKPTSSTEPCHFVWASKGQARQYTCSFILC